MSIPLDSTYDVWMVALVLETFLFGMDVLQTWIYFAGRPIDVASIKWTVSSTIYIHPSETKKIQVLVVLCAALFPSLLTPQLFVRALETIQVIFFSVRHISASSNDLAKYKSISSGKQYCLVQMQRGLTSYSRVDSVFVLLQPLSSREMTRLSQ
jgi:hypothetical protein